MSFSSTTTTNNNNNIINKNSIDNIIVHKIVERCKEREEPCSDYLAAFVARRICIHNHNTNTNNNNNESSPLTQKDIDEIIVESSDKICEKDSPNMSTIKMQISFESIRLFTLKKIQLKEIELMRKAKEFRDTYILRLPDEKPSCNNNLFFTELYNNIMRYVQFKNTIVIDLDIHKKEMSIPTTTLIDHRIISAVESAFPKSGLKSFILLSTDIKKKQIEELCDVVLGIRLFNKECWNDGSSTSSNNNGGSRNTSEIESLDKICLFESEDLMDRLKMEMDIADAQCQRYNSLKRYLKKKKKMNNNNKNDCDDDCGKKEMEKKALRWKDELTNKRQYLSFLRLLHDEISVITKSKILKLKQSYSSTMENLSELVVGQTTTTTTNTTTKNKKKSVPKEYVFPKFELISQTWCAFKKERDDVLSLKERFETLLEHKDGFENTWFHVNIDDENDEDKSCCEDDSKKETLVQSSHHFDPRQRMEFQGFCPITLLEHSGLLVLGNPKYGVVQYRGKHYIFDSVEAKEKFLSNNEKILQEIYSGVVKQNPELMTLLNIQERNTVAAVTVAEGENREFVGLNDSCSTKNDDGEKNVMIIDMDQYNPICTNPSLRFMKKKDVSVETPLHFMESNIVKGYEWNEWELRKLALERASLMRLSCAEFL